MGIGFKLSSHTEVRIGQGYIVDLCADVFHAFPEFAVCDFSQLAVYKVSLDNVVTDTIHKLLVIVMSFVEVFSNVNDFSPMKGSAHISSDVSLIVASSFGRGGNSLIDVILGGVAFNPGEPD